MKLLTKKIEQALAKAPLYSTEKSDVAPVIVKFFDPTSNWTWYVLEGEKLEDGDWRFFGLVEGHEKELGYFMLFELAAVRGRFGLKVERDLHFDGMEIVKSTNTVRRVEPPVDFRVQNEGTIFLLCPYSTAARAWVSEHIPADAQRLGNAVAVEHRYIADIVAGIQADGLVVR